MNVTYENFIGIYEDAFSEEYCDKVIKYFNDCDKAGLCFTRQHQSSVRKIEQEDLQLFGHSTINIPYMVEFTQEFNSVFWNSIYTNYADKFDVLKTYEPHTNYAFKVQKTEIGQGYHIWHSEDSTRAVSSRILAWMLYLNDVDEGGETEFLYYPKRIKPRTGTLILWPAGFTHAHRGNPPLSDTKYVITGWLEF